MLDTNLITPPRPWTRLFAANQTGASITTPTPTTTAPTGTNVIDLTGGAAPSNLAFAFFGAGSDDQTAVARITGWKRCVLTGSTPIWVPTPLASLNLTLSTAVGVAGAAIINADRFCDIIAEATVYTTAKEIVQAASPDNTLAVFKLDVFGHEYVQVDVGTGSSATNVNGIYSGF